MLVRDWMSSPAVGTSPLLGARDALAFMEEHDLPHLPVIEAGRLVGVLERQRAGSGLARSASRSTTIVEDLMAHNPVTVSSLDAIETVARLMVERGLHSVTVVDGGKVTGILTETQILSAFCELLGLCPGASRIVLNIQDSENPLDALSRKINVPAVRSLTTFRSPASGCWEVVLRASEQKTSEARP